MHRTSVTRTRSHALACASLALLITSACGEIGPEGDASDSVELNVDALTDASWMRCAKQGQFCSFSGTRRVRYSSPSRSTIKTFSGGVQCDGAQFGVRTRTSATCDFEVLTPSAGAPAAGSGGFAGAPLAGTGSTGGGVVISSALRLDKSSVRVNETLSASVTYKNTGSAPVSIQQITIAARKPGATHSGGPYDDLSPSQAATTIAAGASVTLTATRTFTNSDTLGQWEAYATLQDAQGAWRDGPSVFFSVAAPVVTPDPTPTPTPTPSKGMKLGTNFWYHTKGDDNWTGETSMKNGIDWSTAYGSGTNGLGATNIWNDTFVAELAPYSTLRFMDWGNTNHSKITSWSQRMLPTDPKNYEAYIDASSPANNPGIAYEWMIDLGNRLHKDIWICLPAKADADYWRQLATLLKNKLQADRKVYVEYSNETWNGSFTQMQYTMDQGSAQGLPGSNEWYKGQSYAVWQSLKIFKAFEDVFGASAMGTRVIRVYAYGGNVDTGRQALKSVYKSSSWNSSNQKIDMLAVAPYIGHSLDGASSNIQSQFHHAIDTQLGREDNGDQGLIAWAVEDKNTFGIPQLGTYEGGQHLLKNSMTWSKNPRIYDEYTYMLDRWSQHFTLFVHYTHTGKWTNDSGSSSWGAKDHTGQSLSEAHKYRALVDWIAKHP